MKDGITVANGLFLRLNSNTMLQHNVSIPCWLFLL